MTKETAEEFLDEVKCCNAFLKFEDELGSHLTTKKCDFVLLSDAFLALKKAREEERERNIYGMFQNAFKELQNSIEGKPPTTVEGKLFLKQVNKYLEQARLQGFVDGQRKTAKDSLQLIQDRINGYKEWFADKDFLNLPEKKRQLAIKQARGGELALKRLKKEIKNRFLGVEEK